MYSSLQSLEDISSQMRLLLLFSLLILVVYLLFRRRIERVSFQMFLPTTQSVALTRQQFINPDIEYSVSLEFYKPFSFFCNCRILLTMKKLPYSKVVTSPASQSVHSDSEMKRLSSSYVLKNYPYSDLQAHQKYLSNSKKKGKKEAHLSKDTKLQKSQQSSKLTAFVSSVCIFIKIVLFVPRQLYALGKFFYSFIDQLSIEKIKVYRLTKKFPLFLDFLLPSRVKHIKLNGVTLPPVIHNGRIYIDDRFLKLGQNEIRIQYYSKVNMLPVGLMQDDHRLVWRPDGIGLSSLFPSFDQSLFNITLSCQSTS